ncbi:MAG: hypothetical protein Q8Q41_03480 [bacterium]|nr:hypothetical protein [bacterium]
MGIQLTSAGFDLMRRRVLEALRDPRQEKEMRRVAQILGIDLERLERLVAEEYFRRAAAKIGIKPGEVERLLGRAVDPLDGST